MRGFGPASVSMVVEGCLLWEAGKPADAVGTKEPRRLGRQGYWEGESFVFAVVVGGDVEGAVAGYEDDRRNDSGLLVVDSDPREQTSSSISTSSTSSCSLRPG